jgi:hypothetical protein
MLACGRTCVGVPTARGPQAGRRRARRTAHAPVWCSSSPVCGMGRRWMTWRRQQQQRRGTRHARARMCVCGSGRHAPDATCWPSPNTPAPRLRHSTRNLPAHTPCCRSRWPGPRPPWPGSRAGWRPARCRVRR